MKSEITKKTCENGDRLVKLLTTCAGLSEASLSVCPGSVGAGADENNAACNNQCITTPSSLLDDTMTRVNSVSDTGAFAYNR